VMQELHLSPPGKRKWRVVFLIDPKPPFGGGAYNLYLKPPLCKGRWRGQAQRS